MTLKNTILYLLFIVSLTFIGAILFEYCLTPGKNTELCFWVLTPMYLLISYLSLRGVCHLMDFWGESKTKRQDLCHGRKLTEEEYHYAVHEIHRRLTGFSEDIYDRAMLEITIDHRLGVDFPTERREKLWEAQKNTQKRRVLATAIFTVFGSGSFDYGSSYLAGYLLREYKQVLTPDEMNAYFGESY